MNAPAQVFDKRTLDGLKKIAAREAWHLERDEVMSIAWLIQAEAGGNVLSKVRSACRNHGRDARRFSALDDDFDAAQQEQEADDYSINCEVPTSRQASEKLGISRRRAQQILAAQAATYAAGQQDLFFSRGEA